MYISTYRYIRVVFLDSKFAHIFPSLLLQWIGTFVDLCHFSHFRTVRIPRKKLVLDGPLHATSYAHWNSQVFPPPPGNATNGSSDWLSSRFAAEVRRPQRPLHICAAKPSMAKTFRIEVKVRHEDTAALYERRNGHADKLSYVFDVLYARVPVLN